MRWRRGSKELRVNKIFFIDTTTTQLRWPVSDIKYLFLRSPSIYLPGIINVSVEVEKKKSKPKKQN
jgi:hypothetical protein